MTILLTLDNVTRYSVFNNVIPGVWSIPISINVDSPFSFGTFWATTDPYNRVRYTIESVEKNYIAMSITTSYSDMLTTADSFYYDKSNSVLYINTDDEPYNISTIDVGLGLTYSKSSNPNGYVSDDGVFYDPLLKSIPNITYAKDDFVRSIPKNESLTLQLINTEEENNLDNIASLDLYGNPARIKIATVDNPTDSDFTEIFSGRIDDIPKVGLDSVTIKLNNQRKFLNVPIASRTFTTDEYPDLDDDTIGQNIPIAIGQCRNVPCICVNKETSGSTLIYKVCDTDPTSDFHFDIEAISVVRVDGVTKTASNKDLVNGTFELSDTVAKDGDKFLDVTADISGWKTGALGLIENSLIAVRTLNEVYANIPYNSSRYDLVQWDTAQSSAHDISYWTDGAKLRDFIELATQSELGVFTDQPDGLFRFYFSDLSGAASQTIYQYEQFNLPVAVPTVDRVRSSVAIKYNREWNTNKSRQVVDTTNEQSIFQRFRFKERLTVETLLQDKTDAESYATDILSRLNAEPTFIIELSLSDYYDLFITDIINIEINRVSCEWYGTIKAEIEKVVLNTDSEKAIITVKYIEEA